MPARCATVIVRECESQCALSGREARVERHFHVDYTSSGKGIQSDGSVGSVFKGVHGKCFISGCQSTLRCLDLRLYLAINANAKRLWVSGLRTRKGNEQTSKTNESWNAFETFSFFRNFTLMPQRRRSLCTLWRVTIINSNYGQNVCYVRVLITLAVASSVFWLPSCLSRMFQ